MKNVKITPEIIEEHGVSPEEYQTILNILGREPNLTELGIFSVMWSEHCSYKNSKPLLVTFPTTGEQVLQGPGENAGIVDFDDKYALCFKMESHNHPSALEPFQGAATGVGGILRDIFTMGARPIALLDPLRFGDPSDPHVQRIFKGVVEGIADYGNAVGVPTVGGECYFSPAYNANPLVNVMCVGLIEKDKITRAVASGVGNLVVYYGNSTGRDGIHGATFASQDLTEESEAQRSAVQVGDPFTEKKILEATLELINAKCVVAIQDMGAAGLTCSCAEMAGRGGMGISIELNEVPQRAENLSAYEMMLSESQERMLAICEPGQLEEVRSILQKWDLDAHVLGTLNDSGLMKVYHNGELEAEIPADKVSENSPVYHRESQKPKYMDSLPDAKEYKAEANVDLEKEVLTFLGSPNICSKRWVYQQFDHMVQTQTVVEPGDNTSVLKIHDSGHHVAMTADGNGQYVYVDPYEGGKLAVAEAARNIAVSGALPLAITNCLNFGNPQKPEIFFQLKEAVRGIGDACKALNTPVTGGNVSLYNENPTGAIWPTPIIGMVGKIEAPATPVTAGFKAAGQKVALVGPNADHLGASEYLRWKTGKEHGPCPTCDLDHEKNLIKFLVEAGQSGKITAAHDSSVGGLVVTLSEMVLRGKPEVGLKAALSGENALVELFAETAGRVAISVANENVSSIEELANSLNLPFAWIGETVSDSNGLELSIGENTLKIGREQLFNAHESMESILPTAGVER